MKETTKIIIIRLLSGLFCHAKITKRFIRDVQELINKNGKSFAVSYMKTVRLCITRYISGKPLLVNKSLVSTRDGFPTKFLYLKEFLGTRKGKMFILTLLTFTRSLKDNENKIKPNYNTITDKYSGKDYSIPLYFIRDFVKTYRLNSSYTIDNENHYFSRKSSPSGKATLNGMFDLFTMANVGHDLLNHLMGLIGSSYDKYIVPAIEMVWKDHRTMKATDKPCLGRLAIINDPELKKRVIAMVDYYSQWALKPIHENCLNKLRNFPCDRTFTQDPFHNWGKTGGNKFWSLDLSSATDRFPISLQEKLVSIMYNNRDFASSWRKLLTDRSYVTPEGEQLRYEVGQPMGAYSSWAVFSLTHHLTVAWAANLAGLDWRKFDRYILLGDDIVINHDKVARKYLSIMRKLGVDISETKTHVSKNTYEFAKRWIQHKIEISGLPLGGIIRNIDNIATVTSITVGYIYRTYFPLKGTSRDLLYYCYNKMKIKGKFLPSKLIKSRIDSSIFVIRYNLKLTTYEDIKLYINKYCKLEEFNVPKDEIYRFMDRVFSLGLNARAEKTTIEIKGFTEKFMKPFDGIDVAKLMHSNIVHAVYNKLIGVKRAVMKLNSDQNLQLVDVISLFNVDSPDTLLLNLRSGVHGAIHLDKIWRSSINHLNQITEVNFGNFDFDPNGLMSRTAFTNYFLKSLSDELNKLDQVRYGTYGKAQDIMQFW